MTDPNIITISAGAQSDIEPGVYEVTLIDISDVRTILPQTGPNAGKEVTLRDWTFALEDGTTLTGSASTASGPKSKSYSWLTALLGRAPAPGEAFPKSQLVGREALATVTIDDGGWPRIANLSARPKAKTPAARPQIKLGDPRVSAGPADDLPF